MTGLNQSAARFNTTMFEKFSRFYFPGACGKTHGGRTAESVRSKFNEISADIQIFCNALHRVTTSFPLRFTYDDVLSMAIAIHFGNRSKLCYEAKKYPHIPWKNRLTYKALRHHLKYSDEDSFDIITKDDTQPSAASVHDDTCQSTLDGSVPFEHEVIENSTFSNKQKAKELHDKNKGEVDADNTKQRPGGRKTTLLVRAVKDIRCKSLHYSMEIASSLTRSNELAEEKTAVLAHRKKEYKTREDLEDWAEFLRYLRKKRLHALCQCE